MLFPFFSLRDTQGFDNEMGADPQRDFNPLNPGGNGGLGGGGGPRVSNIFSPLKQMILRYTDLVTDNLDLSSLSLCHYRADLEDSGREEAVLVEHRVVEICSCSDCQLLIHCEECTSCRYLRDNL